LARVVLKVTILLDVIGSHNTTPHLDRTNGVAPMFRTLIARLSAQSSAPRRRRATRVVLNLDAMEERVVPATIGFARGAALAAQQIGSMGATTRAVQASIAQYQSGVNRLMATYNRQSAQILSSYNARMSRIASQLQSGVTSAASAWEGQVSRQYVPPTGGGGGTSTIGDPTPPLPGTNPPPEFTQPITRGASGGVSTAAADGATTLPPEFSVPITRTLTAQITQAQQQAAANLARLNQQTLAGANSFTGRFNNLGSTFSSTSSGFTTALASRFQANNAAFSQLRNGQADLFRGAADSFRTLTRQLDTTSLNGTLDTFRGSLASINERFNTNLGNLGSDFSANTTISTTSFGSALGQLNDRFNTGLRDNFSVDRTGGVFDNSIYF
jgi:hypothetical protein